MAFRNHEAVARRDREDVSNPDCVFVLADDAGVRQGAEGAEHFSHMASTVTPTPEVPLPTTDFALIPNQGPPHQTQAQCCASEILRLWRRGDAHIVMGALSRDRPSGYGLERF